MMSRYIGPPMDLANMRSLGVTKVDVYYGCEHQASASATLGFAASSSSWW
jgi:hypothetical protein